MLSTSSLDKENRKKKIPDDNGSENFYIFWRQPLDHPCQVLSRDM